MVESRTEQHISKLKQNFKQSSIKVLQNADGTACLSDLHSNYVFVQADKSPNNIIIICKRYYIETLIKELDCIIVPFQPEIHPTLHVKCYLSALSILMISS